MCIYTHTHTHTQIWYFDIYYGSVIIAMSRHLYLQQFSVFKNPLSLRKPISFVESQSPNEIIWHTIWDKVKFIVYVSKVKVIQSCLTLCDFMDYTVHGTLQGRILEWVAVPFSRGSNPDLPHCWYILYQLIHQGSPRMLEWIACPFSRCRNQTGVSCIAGGFSINWATGKQGNPKYSLEGQS